MTESLQNAISLASSLPDSEQDALAAVIVAELMAEKRWDAAFVKSPDILASLAKDAKAEHERGETLDWPSN